MSEARGEPNEGHCEVKNLFWKVALSHNHFKPSIFFAKLDRGLAIMIGKEERSPVIFHLILALMPRSSREEGEGG